MTDDEVMAALRQINQAAEFDSKLRQHVSDLGRAAGCHVTCYEVIATRAILFIVHAAPTPSMAAIRKSAEPHLRSLQ
jgi:hypothetical protein